VNQNESPARPITKTEAAKAKGVTQAAVSFATRPGGALHPALLEDGRRINSTHPAYLAWVKSARTPPAPAKAARKRPPVPTTGGPKRGKRAAKATPEPTAEPPPAPPVPAPQGTSELEELSALLRPLLDRYGTARGFRDWLQAAGQLEAVRERKLKNDEREGRLIDRALVSTHLMGALQRLHRRLLGDSAKTIVRRVYAAAKGGVPVEETEAEYRAAIGALLKPAAETTAALLRDRSGDAS